MTDTKIKGILGTKLGMTQVFDENNRVVPVTVIQAGPNVITQLRTADATDYSLGQELTVDGTFEAGQLVDVVGTSKGKGTAGVMKRHNFKGVSASHGAHRNHRKPGSIGGASTPGRVFKGLKMAGRMGHVRKTTQNLTIHAVDAERGLILVKGAVPGPRGGLVLVRTTAKGA